MSTLGRRDLLTAFAGAGAGLSADLSYDPEMHPTISEHGYVRPGAVPWFSGAHVSVPVWLEAGRLVHERTNRPALAGLLYEPLPDDGIAPQVHEEVREHAITHRTYSARQLPRYARIIDARTGEVVLTSELPERILRTARRLVEHSPVQTRLRVHFQCGNASFHRRSPYFVNDEAPYESYFRDLPIPFREAIAYRNFLLMESHTAVVIQALNTDYLDWFWRRMAGVPNLPEPAEMCQSASVWLARMDTVL